MKLILLTTCVMTLLGLVSGLIAHYPDWGGVLGLTMIGGFLGLMLGAELDPGGFRYGRLIQIGAGMIAGAAIAWTGWDGALIPVCVGVLAGGVAGFTAPLWLKYVSFP